MAKKKVRKTAKKATKKTVAKKRPVARVMTKPKKIGMGFALTVFITNLILPGLGTLLAQYTRAGIWQVILTLIGFIGIYYNSAFYIVWIASLIWAFIFSVHIVRKASQ